MPINLEKVAKKAQLDNLNQREGTHNTATYRSASLALFKLIYHYLVLNGNPQGLLMEEMTLEKFNQIKSYVENWTRRNSVDNLGDLFRSRFVAPMEEILSPEENVIFQKALAHAALGKKPFEEKTNEAVWRVDETAFNDRHLQVPLQLVLIIVVMALVDFKHVPGQAEVQIKQDRLKIIFNALKEQLEDSVCALGVRHYLLFLVQNVIEGGLGIVVDEDNALLDELRLRVFGKIEKNLDRRLLQEFLADNLCAKSLIKMAQVVNLEQEISNRLKTLGIYDKEQLIREYTDSLASLMPDKSQQPMLYALHLLQGKIKVLPANLAQKAKVFLANLISNFNPASDRAKLITLTDMIEKLVLILTQARFLKWLSPDLQICWDGLQNFINFPDLNSMLEQYAAHSEDIDKLCGAIRKWQSSNRVERVQRFFRDWAEENQAKIEMDNLAALLFDPKFYGSVKLSEENIIALMKAPGDLNEYEINRVFLHGLLTPRQEWTKNFNELLSILFCIVKNPDLKGVQEQLKWMQNSAAWRQNELAKMANEPEWRKIKEPIPGHGLDGYDGRLILTAPFLASCVQESPDCVSKVLVAAKERIILASPVACAAVIQMISEHQRWTRDQKYKLVQMQQPGWDSVFYETLAWGNAQGVKIYLAALLASSLFTRLSQDQKRALLLVSNSSKEAAWWRALQDNKVEALTEYLTVILSARICQELGVEALQTFIFRSDAELTQLVSVVSQQHGVSALQVYFELILESDFFRQLPLEVQNTFSQSHQNCFPPAVSIPLDLPDQAMVIDRTYLGSSDFTELSFEDKAAILSDVIKNDSRLADIWQDGDLFKAYQAAIIGLRPSSEKERDEQKWLFMSLQRWDADGIVELTYDLQGEAIDFAPELQFSFSCFLQLFAANKDEACDLLRNWASPSVALNFQHAHHPGLFQASDSEDSSMNRGKKRLREGVDAQDEEPDTFSKLPRFG